MDKKKAWSRTVFRKNDSPLIPAMSGYLHSQSSESLRIPSSLLLRELLLKTIRDQDGARRKKKHRFEAVLFLICLL